MKLQLIANSYASALLELAHEKKSAETLYKALKKHLPFFEINAVQKTLDNPLLEKKDHLKLIDIFSVKGVGKDLLLGLLKTLSSYSRLGLLPLVLRSYCSLYQKKIGEYEITLITAQDFDKLQEEKLIKNLESHLKRKISFNRKIQKKILAGFILEFDGKRIDLSLKGTLKQFANHGSIR